MSEKLKNSYSSWVDPDDAPELNSDFFSQGEWRIGEQAVSAATGVRALGKAASLDNLPIENSKQVLTVRFDSDVVEAFRSSGHGWQARMNAALKDWLQSHKPAA